MQVKEGHPKGLYLCFSVEMWERFSFYGMRALLVLFMVKYLLFDTEKAGKIYGWYLGLVYLAPLVGGYVSDRYWGQNKSIIFGGLVMAVGQFLLAGVAFMSPELINTRFIWLYYTSLLVIILGCGFIKANISTAVSSLYERNDPRRDGAYTIFYMGINLGAFFAPLLCGTLGEKVGWGWGFFSAGALMLVGVLNYMMYNRKLLPECVFHPAGAKKRAADGSLIAHEPLTKEEKERLYVIFIMAFFVIFFWMAFEQAGSSLTLFTDRSTDRWIHIGSWSWEVPTTYFQALNPIFIFVLAPFFSKMWVGLAKKNLEPSTPVKFVWGLALLCLGFVVMYYTASLVSAGSKVNMLFITLVYLFHTLGELCLSPVGLSMVTKLSPLRFASLMMGTWFFATFIGNLTAGLYAGQYDKMTLTQFFGVIVIATAAASVILLVASRYIRRWMHGIH